MATGAARGHRLAHRERHVGGARAGRAYHRRTATVGLSVAFGLPSPLVPLLSSAQSERFLTLPARTGDRPCPSPSRPATRTSPAPASSHRRFGLRSRLPT